MSKEIEEIMQDLEVKVNINGVPQTITQYHKTKRVIQSQQSKIKELSAEVESREKDIRRLKEYVENRNEIIASDLKENEQLRERVKELDDTVKEASNLIEKYKNTVSKYYGKTLVLESENTELKKIAERFIKIQEGLNHEIKNPHYIKDENLNQWKFIEVSDIEKLLTTK